MAAAGERAPAWTHEGASEESGTLVVKYTNGERSRLPVALCLFLRQCQCRDTSASVNTTRDLFWDRAW
eukprot:scaffold23177_cov28-Tisochrysis_lutea.AAC.1